MAVTTGGLSSPFLGSCKLASNTLPARSQLEQFITIRQDHSADPFDAGRKAGFSLKRVKLVVFFVPRAVMGQPPPPKEVQVWGQSEPVVLSHCIHQDVFMGCWLHIPKTLHFVCPQTRFPRRAHHSCLTLSCCCTSYCS